MGGKLVYRIIGAAAAAVVAICALPVTWALFRLAQVDVPGLPNQRVSYPEYVSLLLTGLTIVLAVLGIVIAIAAFWGYQGIEAKVSDIARDEVSRYLNSDNGKELLETVTQPQVQEKIRAALEATAVAQAYSTNGGVGEEDLTQKLGEEYPEVKEVKDDRLDGSSQRG